MNCLWSTYIVCQSYVSHVIESIVFWPSGSKTPHCQDTKPCKTCCQTAIWLPDTGWLGLVTYQDVKPVAAIACTACTFAAPLLHCWDAQRCTYALFRFDCLLQKPLLLQAPKSTLLWLNSNITVTEFQLHCDWILTLLWLNFNFIVTEFELYCDWILTLLWLNLNFTVPVL